MNEKLTFALESPYPSCVMAETREAGNRRFDVLPPDRRMEAAFALSMDVRKLREAGLRAQGFTEDEIRRIASAVSR